jgi:uncharacterized metal-binding protein
MSSVDQISHQLGVAVERKRWETPTVTVAAAERQTLSNFNSGGVDIVYPSHSSSIGS